MVQSISKWSTEVAQNWECLNGFENNVENVTTLKNVVNIENAKIVEIFRMVKNFKNLKTVKKKNEDFGN